MEGGDIMDIKKEELRELLNNIDNDNSKKVLGLIVHGVMGINDNIVMLKEDLEVLKDNLGFVKDNVENLQKVTIINGGGDNVRQTMEADEFHQLMYNKVKQNQLQIEILNKTKGDRGRFKLAVGQVSWWVDNLYRIIVPVAILLGYLGYVYLSKMVEKLPQ